MNKDEIKLYRRALEKWGVEAQIGMLHEEMAELIIALNKWQRRVFSAGKILEEIVDVEIMLEQLRIIINSQLSKPAEEDIISIERSIRAHKLKRLLERLGPEENQGG